VVAITNHPRQNAGHGVRDTWTRFFQLNELPKGVKTILDKLAIPRPRKVFGVQYVEKGGAIT